MLLALLGTSCSYNTPALQAVEACDLAIVGAGPGGIYFAWRLLAEQPSVSVCMYERSERFGGRIYTLRGLGPKKDLTADMGAYRFVDVPTTEGHGWSYIFTPLVASLVENALKLPFKPYEPGDPNSHMKKIVDAEGQNAGFRTFVEKMEAALHGYGARFRLTYKEELVALEPQGSATLLTFASGRTVSAAKVFLNLPQLPLLKVLDRSDKLLADHGLPPALQTPAPTDGVKLYVHYGDAWWRNILDLESGEFGASGFNSSDRNDGQLPELSGRYHDGHTRCDGPQGAECRGFLEATYTYRDAARWFLNHNPSAEPPFVTLNYSQPTGKYALDLIHTALLGYHAAALSKVSGYNATAAVEKLRPDFALLSYWGPQTAGYGGAIHGTRPGPLVNETDLAALAMQPFGARPIYLANEAFGALRGSDGKLGTHHGWAECSLVMAENVLTSAFGIKPPEWINATTYDKYVRFHSSARERSLRGGWHQG